MWEELWFSELTNYKALQVTLQDIFLYFVAWTLQTSKSAKKLNNNINSKRTKIKTCWFIIFFAII